MDARQNAKQLVIEWLTMFGPRLRSALLYGSVVRGEAVKELSDVNVMLLLDTIDAGTLKRASHSTRVWLKTAREAPLLFEWDQWQRAHDVFAIELADMQDAHEVLHGDDPLAGATIDESAIRLQAERELRGKLLQLQTGLLVAGETPADVGKLLMQSIPSFTTYMRTILRLAGQPARSDTLDVINRACAVVGGSADPYVQVWEARLDKRSLKVAVDDPLVDAYYDTAERMADYVDTLRR